MAFRLSRKDSLIKFEENRKNIEKEVLAYATSN